MGYRVAEVRAMTPQETALVISGFNDAQKAASGEVDAPSDAEYEALLERYG